MKLLVLHCLMMVFFQQSPIFSQKHTSTNSQTEKGAIYSLQEDTLMYLLASDNELTDGEKSTLSNRLKQSVKRLEEDAVRGKSRLKMVQKVRKEIFTNYLKEYKQLSTFGEGLKDGSFDCVTAALMYVYFFEKLAIEYQIYELTYHVYLLVPYKENKQLLIEVTDPYYGLIVGRKNIEARIERYEKDNLAEELVENDKHFLATNLDLNQEIDFQKLASLQLYNQAVRAFNQQAFKKAWQLADISYKDYPCERSAALLRLSNDILESMQKTSQLYPRAERVLPN